VAIFTIAHTATSGTTLDGSSRGDGTAEIAKSHGLRWSRTASLWYLPRTRDTTPNQGSIENLARALRARGDDVELDIDATQRDVGDAEETMPAAFEGEPLEIGFNPEFLKEGIESVEGDEVVLRLISPLRPGLLQPVDNEDFRYLVMPIRLNV